MSGLTHPAECETSAGSQRVDLAICEEYSKGQHIGLRRIGGDSMLGTRHELHQEAVDALLESKAIDFEAVGRVLADQGARLAKEGVDFSVIINWRVMDICIPPDPFRLGSLVREIAREEIAAEQQG
jgi:hypothetical protein